MKKAKTYIGSIFLICVLIASCAKETTPKPEVLKASLPIVGSDEYYAALRAYKKTDHAICFGWWGNSGVRSVSPDMTLRYEGLPDSMDIVSLWGGKPDLTDPAWAEMQSVRKRKGTKFVLVLFGSTVNDWMQKNDSALYANDIMASIDTVAKAIVDTINKYQLDGFDLDYEPNFGDGGIFGHGGAGRDAGGDIYTQRLFKAFSKYLGPLSGTGKTLIVDGDCEPGITSSIDYLVQQAYGSDGPEDLEYRFHKFGFDVLPSKKFVVTENMQQYGARGTSFFYKGADVGSVLGMAYWNPIEGRKGGFGAYIMETDAKSNPPTTFYHLQTGIQIQNPAPR
ncbi:MAG: glycoside hydrolase family 18 [Chitinophagaceae bacterium]